jgi:membrane-associated protease RseP (regulator of RpoE activity)
MVVDLGATHSFALDEQEDKKILPPSNHLKSKAAGASGEFDIIRGRIPRFQVGDFQFANVLASFDTQSANPFPNSEEKGNLGMEIMRRFHLVIDYDGKRIFLEPNKFFNEPFETNMSGIKYYWNEENQVVVDGIYDNSAAIDADIQAGDLIVQIDNKPIETYSINDLNYLFQQEGKSLILTILRDGKEISEKIKLRRLI